MGVLDRILTELLVDYLCWQLRPGRFESNKNILIMKLVLILCLTTSTLALPMPMPPSNETWTAWAQEQQNQLAHTFGEGKDQIMQGWEWLQEFLPRKVAVYVEETAGDGQKVFEDIYEETRKSIVEKTSANVDDITNLIESFINKLENIKDSTVDIVYQGEPLTKEQIELSNQEKDLEGTKQELKQLNQEVAQEKEADKQYEGVEGMIQRLITSARDVLTQVNSHTDLFWSKVKQMEVEVYRVNKVMAESTGELKDVLKDLFKTLNKELREASPALKEILEKVEKEEAVAEAAKNNTPRQG